MISLSRHLKPDADALKRVAAAASVLVSGYLCGAFAVDGQLRRAEIAFLLFVAAAAGARCSGSGLGGM